MRRTTLLVMSTLLTLPLVPTASAFAHSSSSSGDRVAPLIPAAQRVTLVTGDVVRLAVDSSGRQTTQLFKAQQTGPGSVFRSYSLGGDQYVVPQSAVPYLGHTLDARLFDVSWLARHPHQQGQVELTLRADVSGADLPGLSERHRSGSRLVASFTDHSARMFGRALARQVLRDHASLTHETGLFGKVRLLAPAAGSARAARPASTDSVLTVKGINWAGAPDTGDGFNIYNIDDMNIFAGSISFQGGTAQITVPDGHYSSLGFFYDFTGQRIYGVEVPQFTVSGDTTITIDARKATADVSFTTPKPSTPKSTQMVLARNDALGALGSYAFLAGTQAFSVAPISKKPKIGALHYSIGLRAYSAGSKQPYTFDLKYGSDDKISADQTYAPSADSLATVDATYAADHSGQQSMDARLAAFSWEENIFGDNILLTTPTRRTEYYTSGKAIIWEGVDYQIVDLDTFATQGVLDQSWRHYVAGAHETTVWGDDPAHPRLLERDLFPDQIVCPACISGSTLNALAFPFGDSSDEHRGYPDPAGGGLSESANWSIFADGDIVQQGTGVLLGAAPVGSADKYRMDYDTTRSSVDFTLSTKTSTRWVIPADAPQADLPAGWTCTLSGGTGCTVLELMTAAYDLPSDTLGRITSGDVKATVTIGHLTGVDVKVKPKIKVSFDGGDTYQPAVVSGGGDGVFTVQFTVPPKGQTDGYGAIQVVAKDANGSTLRETVINAFAVK